MGGADRYLKAFLAFSSTCPVTSRTRLQEMATIPAEFYALANAFLFALHNIFSKKALRHSNPATAVISSLLINIIFLWSVSFIFVQLLSLTINSILLFVLSV